MGRQGILGGVLGVLLGPSFVFAINAQECPGLDALATRSAALVRAPAPLQKQNLPARLPAVWRAGRVLDATEKFSNLPDDRYAFLIVNPTGKPGQEKVVFAPLVPEETRNAALQAGKAPNQFVTTEDTLLRELAQHDWSKPENLENHVLSSGTFLVRSGKQVEMEGTNTLFVPTDESMDYGRAVLKSRGLDDGGVVPKTTERSRRNTLEEEARAFLENHLQQERRDVRERMVMLHDYLVRKYPDPNHPGHFELSALLDVKNRYLKSVQEAEREVFREEQRKAIHERIIREGKELDDVLFYLSRVNREGYDHSLNLMWSRYPGEEGFDCLETLLVSATGMATHSTRGLFRY